MRVVVFILLIATLGLYVVPKGYGNDFISRIQEIWIDEQRLDPRNSNQTITLNIREKNAALVHVAFSDGKTKDFVLQFREKVPTSTPVPLPTPIIGQSCAYGEEKFEKCTGGCYNNCGDASYFICGNNRVWEPTSKTIKCDERCNQYCISTPTPIPSGSNTDTWYCPDAKKYSGFCIQTVVKACSQNSPNMCCWYGDPCSVPEGWIIQR